MPDAIEGETTLEAAARLLGSPMVVTLGPGEPEVGAEFLQMALDHTFGGVWQRPGLDLRSRALISVTIAAVLGTPAPLAGQIRIALNNGVTKEEIVELFIHVQVYAGASRAVEGYQLVKAIFAETAV